MSLHPADEPTTAHADGLPAAPPPPRFWALLDWRLLASIVAIGALGVASCDVVNAGVASRVNQWLGRARPAPNPAAWKVGATAEVELTLITKDADRLSCADDGEFDGARCEFKRDKRRWPFDPEAPLDDNRQRVIQPYRTATGNHLVLVSGLWATPALAMRRHLEPGRGVADKELKRFVARCQLEFLGSMKDVEVRWDFNQKWYKEPNGPVARAIDCEIPSST